MTTRTFIQKGQGYGSEPVSIVAKINGTTVYSGPVPTTAEEPPALPNAAIDLGEEIFRFTNTVDFQGSVQVEILVQENQSDPGFLFVTDTLANYILVPDPEAPVQPAWKAGGPDTFGFYFFETKTDVQGEWISSDPQVEVAIDDVAVEPHPVRTYPGQYYWAVYPGQVFTCTLNIQPGVEFPAD